MTFIRSHNTIPFPIHIFNSTFSTKFILRLLKSKIPKSSAHSYIHIANTPQFNTHNKSYLSSLINTTSAIHSITTTITQKLMLSNRSNECTPK